MLSEKIETQVTVKPDGRLEVKDTNIIFRGDVEISRIPHRKVVDVGADVSGESDMVKELAGSFHTSKRIAARKVVLDKLKING